MPPAAGRIIGAPAGAIGGGISSADQDPPEDHAAPVEDSGPPGPDPLVLPGAPRRPDGTPSADTATQAGPPTGEESTPPTDVGAPIEGQDDLTGGDAEEDVSVVTSPDPSLEVEVPALALGERLGSMTGQPTTLLPLPTPPVAVVRTTDARTVDDGHADGLHLPAPPRDADGTPRPPAHAVAADGDDAPAAAVTLATVDMDVRASLPPLTSPEGSAAEAPAANGPDGSQASEESPARMPDSVWAPERAGDAPPADSAPTAVGAARPAVAASTDDGAERGHEVPLSDGPPADADPVRQDPAAGVQAVAGPAPAAGDRPWVRTYPQGVPETYRYPLVPVTRFLDDAAQDFPDVIAVSFLGSDTSYRQLSEQVDRLAAAMTDLGLRPGDRIAVALPWSPQLVMVLHAAWRGALDPVVLDPDTGPEQLAAAVQTAAPELLVVLDTLYLPLATYRERLGSVRHVIASSLLECLPVLRARVQAVRLKLTAAQIPAADGVLALRDVLDGAAPTATQVDLAVETAVAVSLVDGDRVVSLTHANLLAGAFQARLWIPDFQAGREGLVLAGSPADTFALGAGLGLAMLAAATLVLPEPRQGGVARAIDDRRPTIFVAPSAAVRKALAPASKRRDLSSIRVTLASGAAFDPAVRTAMEQRTGGRLRNALSCPQAAGMAVAQAVYAEPREGSAGVPVTDTDIRVEGADARGVGALQVSGPQVSGDGWTSLGIIGSVDPQVGVVVVGPVGRVVVHAGGASDPEVVGAVLRRSDAVVEALVRTEFAGGELRMIVQAVVADVSTTESDLVAILRTDAPAQALPHHWIVTVVAAPPVEPLAPPAASLGVAGQTPASDGGTGGQVDGGGGDGSGPDQDPR